MIVKKYEQDGLIFEIRHELDYSPADWLTDPDRYAGVPARERAKYERQDRDRIAAMERGEWYPMVVCCDVRIRTPTNWVSLPIVGRASVWGVESDSEPAFLEQLAVEMAQDARRDVEALRAALAAVPELPA